MKSIINDYALLLKIIFQNLKVLHTVKNLDFHLVTASDKQHFLYLENLLKTYNKNNNKKKFTKLFIFDLGLTDEQVKTLEQYSNIELRKFPFDNYPSFFNERLEEHNYKLGGFAWKPFIIDILKNEGIANIIWLDSASLFNSRIFLFKLLVYENGFASFYSSGPVKNWTHNSVLKQLDLENNKYILNSPNLMAGVIGFSFKSEFASSLLEQWCNLAIQKELIVPEKSTIDNHRHDQSLLSILYWSMTKNKLPSNISIFGIKIQNWPNKILFFYDEKNDIKKGLLKKYLFNSTTTNKRSKVIILLNAKSLKKIPLRLIISKKVILFVTDNTDIGILKKFKIKKHLIKIYYDEKIDFIYNQKNFFSFKSDGIDEIISNEYRIALNDK